MCEEVKDIGKERRRNGQEESTRDDICNLIGEHTTMDAIFSLNGGNDAIEEQQKQSTHATSTSKTIETRVRSRHVRIVTPLY